MTAAPPAGPRIERHDYAYGPHPSQFVRLLLPGGPHLSVAIILHGGFWRERHGAETVAPLAADLVRFGVAAAVVEYRRIGAVTSGGGWPTTLADVARAVDSLATTGQRLADGRLDLARVAVIGHSAGGHLAAWLTHRPALRHGTAGSVGPATAWVPVTGAVALAGLLDLVAASDEDLGGGAAAALLGGPARSVPQRYDHASPLAHVGDGARVVRVHGDADRVVPISQSLTYAAAALAAGDPARMIVVPGADHADLVEVGSPAWETGRDELLRML